jgi:hypothetical protein
VAVRPVSRRRPFLKLLVMRADDERRHDSRYRPVVPPAVPRAVLHHRVAGAEADDRAVVQLGNTQPGVSCRTPRSVELHHPVKIAMAPVFVMHVSADQVVGVAIMGQARVAAAFTVLVTLLMGVTDVVMLGFAIQLE